MHGIDSNQNKTAYCEFGEQTERRFLINSFNSGVSFAQNPAKHENKYTHDLFAMFPADLKTQFTPFRTANRYGINPDHAITINQKDIERYNKLYPNIILIIDVQFPNYQATHYAPLFMLNILIKKERAKLHEYRERKDDNLGNAKASYVFDVLWFPRI
jgi:hypothetical protein